MKYIKFFEILIWRKNINIHAFEIFLFIYLWCINVTFLTTNGCLRHYQGEILDFGKKMRALKDGKDIGLTEDHRLWIVSNCPWLWIGRDYWSLEWILILQLLFLNRFLIEETLRKLALLALLNLGLYSALGTDRKKKMFGEVLPYIYYLWKYDLTQSSTENYFYEHTMHTSMIEECNLRGHFSKQYFRKAISLILQTASKVSPKK